jgi:hypothetical protein
MALMSRLAEYLWLIFIAFTALSALVWRFRGRRHIEQHPELCEGYNKLTRGLAVWGSIPWLLVGLGQLTGGVTSPDEYLRPSEANPWVLAPYLAAICIWAAFLWWLFRRGGAQVIADHPGLFNFPLTKAGSVKLLAGLTTVSILIAMVALFTHGMMLPYMTSEGDGYTTVFTVYEGFWRVIAYASVFLAVGTGGLTIAIRWIRSLHLPKWWARREGGKPGAVLLWSIAFLSMAIVGFSAAGWRAYGLVRAYRSGAAQVSEGTVHVLRLQPHGGHAKGDLIEVDGAHLVVNHFVVTAAYKQTVAHGGVLREGTQARVWHHDKKVLRIDLLQNQAGKGQKDARREIPNTG